MLVAVGRLARNRDNSFRSACFSKHILLLLQLSRSFASATYVWTGGVTDSSFAIVIEATTADRFLYYPESSTSQVNFLSIPTLNHGLASLNVTGLDFNTTYIYGLASRGVDQPLGTVRTFPPRNEPASFSVAFGSCSKWPAKDQSWKEIAAKRPSFMLHMGDLFYGDIKVDDENLYRAEFEKAIGGHGQRSVFSSMPVTYIFDDHDYGPNDASKSSPSRRAALASYQMFVPHYPVDTTQDSGMYQSFTYGRVRFIISDARSMADNQNGTTLGHVQRQRLFDELAQWKSYSAIVWVSSKPWIGAPHPGDRWSGFSAERTMISNFIATNGISNLVMLAGDAHSLSADSGINTDYSDLSPDQTKGGAGFPLLHSSPMANYGSAKGGPMSEGCSSYRLYPNYHYSILHIQDSPSTVCFSYSGYRSGHEDPEITLQKCIDPDHPSWVVRGTRGGGQGNCSIPLWPSWVTALITIACVTIAVSGISFLAYRRYCVFMVKYRALSVTNEESGGIPLHLPGPDVEERSVEN